MKRSAEWQEQLETITKKSVIYQDGLMTKYYKEHARDRRKIWRLNIRFKKR